MYNRMTSHYTPDVYFNASKVELTENESTEAIFKFDEITKKYEKKKKQVSEPVIPIEVNSDTNVTSVKESCQSEVVSSTVPNASAILS